MNTTPFPFPTYNFARPQPNFSKWIRHALLISAEQMKELLAMLRPSFFIKTGIVSADTWLVSEEAFQHRYTAYLDLLQQGECKPITSLRESFSLTCVGSLADLYAHKVGEDRFLIKSHFPVIQVQLYHYFISSADQKIYPMVLNTSSKAFGLQFSYPQIYEDPHSHIFTKTLLSPTFSTTPIFRSLVQWIRKNTKTAFIEHNGNTIPSQIRISKDK